MADTYTVVTAGLDRLDEAGPLFKAMVDRHRELTGRDWPVRDRDEAWLLLAVSGGGPAAGYAFVRLIESTPTWDLGPHYGELESLTVLPGARGHGVGSQLLGAAGDLLRSQGISYWSLSVVEGNAGARRLYERAGFRPLSQQMIAAL